MFVYILPKLLATRNTADVKGNKLIAIKLHSVSDVTADNPLVFFYDILGRKGDMSCPGHHTRHTL
jgi:hypothetical protein